MPERVSRPHNLKQEIDERLQALDIPFNRWGVDPYGVSRKHLRLFMRLVGTFFYDYFQTSIEGLEHVPKQGRVMIVCNHSGGYAVDAGMLIAACFFCMDPPRLAQAMAEKFLSRLPFASLWTNRTGHVTGLPEHAIRLLEEERLLLVFPEGARGTEKLYHQRHSLVDFGTGFVRLALETRTPIIPAAFVGGGEAVPTVLNLYALGRLLGVPYIPVTPYLVPLPLPVPLQIRFGAPIELSGSGTEDDNAILDKVNDVKQRISELLEAGRKDYEGQ
jgi:1-acyl-sn-glycerol-3-phosphate acyltransferase